MPDRILAHQTSRFTHYYFYIRDEVLGPILFRVASFFPFHATYWLNGHSFIERELTKGGIGFRKDDNAFLAVDDAVTHASVSRHCKPLPTGSAHRSSVNNSTTGRLSLGRSSPRKNVAR